jgi:hypothetical protein
MAKSRQDQHVPAPPPRPTPPVCALDGKQHFLVSVPTKELTLSERNEQASKKLTERFDALNQAIALAEQRLKELKPVRPVWAHYNPTGEHDEPPYAYDVIGMDKVNNQWRLVYAKDDDRNYDSGPWGIQPLTDCPVETRVRAVAELQKLHAKIIESKEKFIPEVEQAINAVLDYCKGGDQ